MLGGPDSRAGVPPGRRLVDVRSDAKQTHLSGRAVHNCDIKLTSISVSDSTGGGARQKEREGERDRQREGEFMEHTAE